MKNAATRRGNNLVSIRFRLPFDYSRITPGHVKLIRLADSTCLRIERTIIGRICRMELAGSSTNRASSTIAAAFSLQGKREFARLMRTINASVPVEGCLRSVERLLLLKNV